jgi:hypothetical protein
MELICKIAFSTIVSLLILSTGVSQISPVTASPPTPLPQISPGPIPVPPRPIPLLDSDRDALPDTWETTGIHVNGDGIVDYNLRAQGANPMHKDIFIEVDFMQFHRPMAQAITNVINSFARAPVSNPDGRPGITLHVVVNEQIPHQNTINDLSGLATIKSTRFGTAAERANDVSSPASIITGKKLAYHYALFIHSRPGTSSSGIGELPGNDFIVSLGATGWGVDPVTRHTVGSLDQQQGTFMHEFGHNLNLRHGGGDNINRKPNYLSVMNYLFQMSSIVANRPLDYSRCIVAALNENSLSEPAGIGRTCPLFLQTFIHAMNLLVRTSLFSAPIDYNTDGDKADTGVAKELNSDGARSTLGGYNDWARILYNFRSTLAGSFGATAGAAVGGANATSVTPSEFGRPLTATTSEPEYSVENLKQDRLKLLAGIEQAIQTLPPTAFRTPEAAVEAKGNLSAEIRTSPTESITALLNANNLNGAIQELTELKARADSTMGGAAADDLIAAPQAQQEVTFLVNNLIQTLEKQK